jgi:hypothetical protein
VLGKLFLSSRVFFFSASPLSFTGPFLRATLPGWSAASHQFPSGDIDLGHAGAVKNAELFEARAEA